MKPWACARHGICCTRVTDNLIERDSPYKRPTFPSEGNEDLTDATIPSGQLALSGPSEQPDAAYWPVRGDLAHIRLAGRCFVPHYAVPMPRPVEQGAMLRSAAQRNAEVLAEIVGDAVFNVLDFTGEWAWGQLGDDGLVGYIALDQLGDE